jgi:hypothetical protein
MCCAEIGLNCIGQVAPICLTPCSYNDEPTANTKSRERGVYPPTIPPKRGPLSGKAFPGGMSGTAQPIVIRLRRSGKKGMDVELGWTRQSPRSQRPRVKCCRRVHILPRDHVGRRGDRSQRERVSGRNVQAVIVVKQIDG